MTNLRTSLMEQVQRIIQELASALPQEELDCGWTDESRESMLVFFKELRQDAEAGVPLSKRPEYATVVRLLDYWGISEGPLCDHALEISACVREVIDSEE